MAKKGAAPLIGPRRHMQAPVEHAMHRKATCLRLLHYFRAEQWRVALLTLIVAVSVAAGVSAPVFMSWAIDAITAAAYEKVPDILLWMFGAFALYAVLLFFQGRLSARLSQSIIRRLRKDLFEKINGLPLVYLDRHPHGDLMSRMTNDADNIATVISTSLGTMFAGLLSIIGTTAVMLSFSVPLTALTWLTAVVTVLMTKYIAAKMGRYFRERQELLGRLNSMVEEEVMAVRTVKAYAREAKVTADFVQTADSLTKTGIRAESIGSSMG
ncbi:MAG: ABC transporter ATP-binding protein, partial [Mitsuokella jalaludinii]|nr:ABC transporter ATP-binding protein [Mitsuokella jalaludinii]